MDRWRTEIGAATDGPHCHGSRLYATTGRSPRGYDHDIDTYLELGKKRVFAGALDWPGWCRGGRDRDSALQALLDYGERYARVLRGSKVDFTAPTELHALRVVEELEGNANTDFGAPSMAPTADGTAVGEAELLRLASVLEACWTAFDRSADRARGKVLRTAGPRGGGRDVGKIVSHVHEAEHGYLSMLGRKVARGEDDEITRTRKAMLDGLAAAAHGEVEAEGPRGGKRWSARHFARRVAWHALDHAWEIEDRLV